MALKKAHKKRSLKKAQKKRALKKASRPSSSGASSAGQSRPGNPSYAGYEYQVEVSVWLALELLLRQDVAESVVIEPRSQEDIEAELRVPSDDALSFVSADTERYRLLVQIKSKSTGVWSARDFANVLIAREATAAAGPLPRARPIEMLKENVNARYLFVTDEAVTAGLRHYHVQTPADWPLSETLPARAGAGLTAEQAVSIAKRIALCATVTGELLNARVTRILRENGHVADGYHAACVSDMREAVRHRMLGLADGRWYKTDILEILRRYEGSLSVSQALDHYVAPECYPAIVDAVERRHAVVIGGPSGTGKSLTAQRLELELRSEGAFRVVHETNGPTAVTAEINRGGAVIFHLRDPWGSNRLTPAADQWRNELPKLLAFAGPQHKFLITSRSDIMSEASRTLPSELRPYLVNIEESDYDDHRLSRIYDLASQDLRGLTRDAALAHRHSALATLRRPLEISRFIDGLRIAPTKELINVDDLIRRSQVDAIASVVEDQTRHRTNGVSCASIIWALLKARSALPDSLLAHVRRSIEQLYDATLDLEGFVEFMMHGRNLRHSDSHWSFAHPRVEDGLEGAMLSNRADSERVLRMLADALLLYDHDGGNWGVETTLLVLKAVKRLSKERKVDFLVALSAPTQSSMDSFLEHAADAAGNRGLDSALRDLADFGSRAHAPSLLARTFLRGAPADPRFQLGRIWYRPALNTAELEALRSDRRTAPLLQRFVQEVLPFSDTHYTRDILHLLRELSPALDECFIRAASALSETSGLAYNADVVLRGACTVADPPFELLIDLFVTAEEREDRWFDDFAREELRPAAEEETHAGWAEHAQDLPGEHYHNITTAYKEIVEAGRERQGFGWLIDHPEQARLAPYWADVLTEPDISVSADELIALASIHISKRFWAAAQQHWDDRLHPLVLAELQRTDRDASARRELLRLFHGLAPADFIPALARALATSSNERLLQTLLDLADADIRGGALRSDERQRAQRKRAQDLLAAVDRPALSEIGSAILDLSDGVELAEFADRLSTASRELIADLLPGIPRDLSSLLIKVAAASGADVVAAAERLLGVDDGSIGEAAIEALSFRRQPGHRRPLIDALAHRRYVVRRAALRSLATLVDASDRRVLLATASDKSAAVRLEFCELMAKHRWTEAIAPLCLLLADQRDFEAIPYFRGHEFSDFRVAQAAARALSMYEALPADAVDMLIATADQRDYKDPRVPANALEALAKHRDPRIFPLLLRCAQEPGAQILPRVRPVATAAAWAIYTRASVELLTACDDVIGSLTTAAMQGGSGVAAPLLMALGIIGDQGAAERCTARLIAEKLPERAELLAVAYIAAHGPRARPPQSLDPASRGRLERLGRDGESGDPILRSWAEGLDPASDVQGETARLLHHVFGLPTKRDASS